MTASGPIVDARSSPAAPNFFSSDPFFEAVAKVFHPGRRWQAEYVEAGGRVYRVLVVGRTIVDQLWVQPFFLEPVEAAPIPAARHINHLRRVSFGQTRYEEVATSGVHRPYEPAPFVDWSGFVSWEDYERGVLRARPLALFRRTQERRRSASRHLGTLEFRPQDDDPAVMDLTARWKSAQLKRTGVADWFADPRARQLYDEFARMGLLTTSTLRAGPRLMAALVGMNWEGRHYARLGSYDIDLATYSPGRLLYFHMLEWSYRQGHVEFDFLMGGEEYKWGLATHARLIGPVGTAPRVRLLARRTRATVGSQLVRWPGLLEGARKLETVIRGGNRGG